MKLDSCGECGALVPVESDCPECGQSQQPKRRGFLSGRAKRWLGGIGGSALAITLMACYGVPAEYDTPCTPTASDVDGDCHEKDTDCDDNSPMIYPGAYDPVGDDVDQNCDGADG